MMKKSTVFLLLGLMFAFNLSGQTKFDTINNYITHTPVTIDGQANEECWTSGEWHQVDQVWIPWAANVPASDFQGRFKVSWDADYLYMLVEIHDDSLSDDHANPLQNWWDDDCLEVFIDENQSGGNHERNNNAFAYHVSLFYDAIDLNSTGGGINYKDHIDVVMDTVGEDEYIWELAIRIYDDSYNNSDPEASRVSLEHNKLMGLSLAYCDNDESTSRENFIGSMVLTSATANDSYINASLFGVMKLIDPASVFEEVSQRKEEFSVFPNPAHDFIRVDAMENESKILSIFSVTGSFERTYAFDAASLVISTSEIIPGAYVFRLQNSSGIYNSLVVIN